MIVRFIIYFFLLFLHHFLPFDYTITIAKVASFVKIFKSWCNMSNKKEKAEEEIEMKDLIKKQGKLDDPDQPLIVSDSEPEIDEEFSSSLKKYNQISRKIRLAAIDKEKKELQEFDKSPKNKYYSGSKTDRIKLLEEEKELLEKMNKLAESKQK